jgi:hypothetical protein
MTSAGQRAAFAKGRLKAGEQNDTEAAYDRHLARLQLDGVIAWYRFEAITLKLAPGASYKVDFFVMLPDGTLEAHEVKGQWHDDARLKIKLAASLFPFRFVAIRTVPKSRGGGWEVEDFSRLSAPLLPDLRLKADVPPPIKRRLKDAPPADPPPHPSPMRRRRRDPAVEKLL